MHPPSSPRPALTAVDGAVLVVGVVLGVGIFRSPSVVAANVDGGGLFLALWVAGGAIALLGALCYAELATAFPDAGGEYHILSEAYGWPVGFLVAWSRMTVIQTGSIAILAYVVGDYASAVLPLGEAGPPAVAAAVVVALTAVNVAGLRQGRWTQHVLTAGAVTALVAVVAAGLIVVDAGGTGAAGGGGPAGTGAEGGSVGLALVFVLLAFGGWNEGAYVSAEIRGGRGGVGRVLLGGTAAITLLYLLANAAYLHGLGLEGVAASDAVASVLLQEAVGPWGERIVTGAIILAALSSANATVITGARSTYALGRDWALFGPLGEWARERNAPGNALLLQGVVALLLVAFGAVQRSGFESMVAYTAPVYWLTLLLAGVGLVVLRRRRPDVPRPYRVPLYPAVPVAFAGASGYMFYSAVMNAGTGALLGLGVVGAGLPLIGLMRRNGRTSGEDARREDGR